jgi:hypothetical protein
MQYAITCHTVVGTKKMLEVYRILSAELTRCSFGKFVHSQHSVGVQDLTIGVPYISVPFPYCPIHTCMSSYLLCHDKA